MSPSWLVEVTDTTPVPIAELEVELDEVVPPGELLERPAHAEAATTMRAIQLVRPQGPYSEVEPLV